MSFPLAQQYDETVCPTDRRGQILIRLALDFMLSAKRDARAAERLYYLV